MNAIMRHPFVAIVAGFFLFWLVAGSLHVVKETEQGVVLRGGDPVRIINKYDPKAPFGNDGAGIAFKIPFVENYVWLDKRVRSVDMPKQQVISTDQRRLEVDAFANYRIIDPERMVIVARSEDQLPDTLAPILGSQLRNELGRRPFASLLSPEREGVMENIRDGLDKVARQYGVQIVDVRIKAADLPDGAPLQAAFDQMRTARQQEARSIRAQGDKQAAIIRADADAEAAKIYAASFGKDPEFYDFYRAMQSYQVTFLGDGRTPPGSTNVILSPSNDYLKEFSGR